MKSVISASLACLFITGCVSAQKDNYTFSRLDGRKIKTNTGLQKQLLVDATICQGETQKVAAGAAPVYYQGLVGAIAAEQVLSQRRAALDDVARGCMAGRGYMVQKTPPGSDIVI